MTYTLSLLEHRMGYLKEFLGDRVKEISRKDSFIVVEITIDCSSDLLDFFHAGVKAGVNIKPLSFVDQN